MIGAFGITPFGKLLVLDIDRARREGPDIVPAIARMQARHNLSTMWIERVAFQLALVQEARRSGIPVRELRPDRDKVSRAMPATAWLEGGKVLLPKTAPWVRDFCDELLSFPVGSHDDQVDVLSYAVEVARTNRMPSLPISMGALRPKQRMYDPSIHPIDRDAHRTRRRNRFSFLEYRPGNRWFR